MGHYVGEGAVKRRWSVDRSTDERPDRGRSLSERPRCDEVEMRHELLPPAPAGWLVPELDYARIDTLVRLQVSLDVSSGASFLRDAPGALAACFPGFRTSALTTSVCNPWRSS
jgi:hypothetical protein